MKHITTPKLAASVLTAVTLTMVGTSAVDAQRSASPAEHEDDHDHGEKSIGYEEAAWADAQLIAKANGYRTSDALRFVEDSRVFAEVTFQMSEKHRDSFATAVYSEDPGDPALIRFSGGVPKGVAEQVRDLGFEVKLDGSAKYSAVEMQGQMTKVHDSLLDAGFDQVVVAANTDQTLEATAYAKGEAKPPRLPRSVKVTVSKEPIAEDHHSRGGGNILNSTNGRICTSGFSVEKNGVHGISTSGHCTTMDKFQEPDTGILYETDNEDSHYGFWGDFQWQSSPTHIDPAEYFARTNEIRDVNTISNWLPVNTPTCSFGQTTQVRNCDEVYNNSLTATFSGPTHYFLMANDNNFSAPGDSGGPISWSTEADGLNKGSITLGGARRQVWVRGSLMPIAIGATIRTK